MIPTTPLAISPESERILQELDLSKAEYTNQWNNRQVLIEWGKPQLESLYYLRIGELLIELLQQKAAAYTAKRKLEMMQAAINRNEEINLPFIEMMVELEMQGQLEKINQEVVKLRQAKYLLDNLDSPKRSSELRKIFREMAKELHPDINPDLPDSAKNLWNAVMLAYDSGDLESLRALRLLVSDVKNKNEQFTDENALLTQIGLLKEGLNRLLEEIKNIHSEFPFTIEKQINDDAWVDEQRSALKKEIATVTEQKLQYEKSISLIIQTLDL
jgi:hypothetical protein